MLSVGKVVVFIRFVALFDQKYGPFSPKRPLVEEFLVQAHMHALLNIHIKISCNDPKTNKMFNLPSEIELKTWLI